ncbi:hypothetical protein NW754_006208 [Fusarium falciforme]|uniref:RING-type domain-containing protein n=1 Tax=Fusarium falciforme TaxID=195108 RepID=A0A9W8V8J2_9HYPO|nr:hypothetical protein NW754_006208 [Fusarium falciforme]KAJ4198093.1 hypothetical protein NW755_000783 [Fusarium falciforme]KAJ4262054.1 hypothetical protein NW757_000323 [Fusarium falciforme]
MEPPQAGLDLEKELTCSICTELLYRPLTLLDCLHTFCGACLKEWFSFQATTAERSPNPPVPGANIFTCPSCRAAVRDTAHNATVVTLLDMYIAANPDKDRSAAEKEEMAKKYKPGDQVLPKVNTHRTAEERRADDEDRRVVEEVRELSLQESGISSGPPRTRRRRESRSADDRGRSGRDRSLDSRQRRPGHRPRTDDGARHSADQLSEGERRHRRSDSRQRQIEHQSSIRSLISSADMSERDIEREIEDFARQIQEEGLLDGLDLDSIDLSRDDELSRRITEAYRRRQRERARDTSRRNNGSSYQSSSRHTEPGQSDSRMLAPDGNRAPRGRPRPHSRSTSAASAASAASQTEERSRPPPSNPSANLEVQDTGRRTRRRTASGSRSATAPVFPTTNEARPAARSSTDLTLRSQTSDPTHSRPSFSEGRSTSTPIHHGPFPNPSEAAASTGNNGNLSFANRQGNTSNASGAAQPSTGHAEQTAGRSSRSRPADLAIVHQTVASPVSSPTVSGQGHQRTRSQLFPEPSISCARCNKPHIEYELHYNCSICASGQWNMCLDCYRAGKGCLYWFGFGYGAWSKWEKTRQQKGDPSMARPHLLTASRYRPPRATPGGADGRKTMTTDDPRHRLESGTFCARCSAWTNECYWRCDVCNEGDWGFCNNCWRYIAQDLVGGRGLRFEPADKPEHREKGLQKWVWQRGDQTAARLVTRDVSETAPSSDGSTNFTQSFPPDGGVGMKASARWGWYPKSGADDELLFPRGAEIKEIEDVNGDWYFGTYMGSRGLFPAPYVRPDQNSS